MKYLSLTIFVFISLVMLSSCDHDPLQPPTTASQPSVFVGSWQLTSADTLYHFYSTTQKDTLLAGDYTTDHTINITYAQNNTFTSIDSRVTPNDTITGSYVLLNNGYINITPKGDTVPLPLIPVIFQDYNNVYITTDTSLSTSASYVTITAYYNRL